MERAKIHPFSLASRTLEKIFLHPVPFMIAFTVPEILRIAAFYASAYQSNVPMNGLDVPSWLMTVVDGMLTAVTIIPIARFVSGSIKPKFWPSGPVEATLLGGLLIVVASLLIDIFGSMGWFSRFVPDFSEVIFDEHRLSLWVGIFSLYSFALSTALISAIYPGLGLIAEKGTLNLVKYRKWLARHYGDFAILTGLLLATLVATRKVYYSILQTMSGSYLTIPIGYDQHQEAIRLFWLELTAVPMDFLFVVVPGIAIGLVHQLLRSHEADP